MDGGFFTLVLTFFLIIFYPRIVDSEFCCMFTPSQRSDTKNTTIMKACQAIANQINAHIEDLKENNEFIDESFYIVKEYFWNHDLPIDSMLFNSTLDLIK